MNLIRKANELQNLSSGPFVSIIDQRTAHEVAGRVYLWQKYGAKTFILSKDLIEAFRHTDIPMESYPKDFQYPFDIFVIEGEETLFTTQTPIGGMRDVSCLMYISDTIVYKDQETNDKVTLINKDNTLAKGLVWNKALTGFYTNILGGLEFLKLNMMDSKTIGEAANTFAGDTNLAMDKNDGVNLVNLFYNTLLYINDPDRNKAETESHGSRKLKVGSKETFKSNYILLKAPKSYVSLSSGNKGGILDKRFVVRGHWRQQAYGEKYSLHKRLWIKPYYKGPEWASTDNKTYKVG